MDDMEGAVYLKDETFEEPEEDIYFLLARNGLFKITKTFFFKASTLFFKPIDDRRLGELRKHRESLKLCLPKKVPFRILEESLEFFIKIYKRNAGEAVSLLYWHENEMCYKLVIPKEQKGEIFSVLGEVGPNPEGTVRVGTLHSHCDWKACHSRTDDADERHDDGLHITLGNITEETPSISCSIVVNGRRFLVSAKDIFENKPDV